MASREKLAERVCPGEDVIEVSLFGPGYGESVAVHVGQGDWLIVDSCTTDGGRPAALEYLKSLGIDVSTAVKLVVSTHWHDDHIRGIAEVYRECTSAQFVCSLALKSEEFFTLALGASGRSKMESSGVDEFGAVLREMDRRSESPRWAVNGLPLWRRDGPVPCLIQALSPSDRSVTQAFRKLGLLLEPEGTPKRRVPPPDRNEGSVAIWLSVGETSLLLGADLIATDRLDTGWNAVVASPHRPAGLAKVYKVAHHGARSADSPSIWSALLSDQPIAILTPFTRGNRSLPTSRDIKRIRGGTEHVYATARSAISRADYAKGAVGRTKREVLRSCRRLAMSPGHVRVRMSIHEPHGKVDCFGNAVSLGTARSG